MEQFHWIRPIWLWAFLPLGMLLWFMFRHTVKGLSWRAVCDPQLLPHILIGRDGERRRWPLIAVALAGVFTILALAGPAWERLPQPVFREQSALVLVLDLSRSMDAADITPTRLTRARHKILDILTHRIEGYTALIVYAGEPFVVTPLTEDAETIAALVPALSTDLMPAQGSRPDLALDKAATLITQADMVRGHVLLLTDGVDDSRVHDAAVRLRNQGHRLSVLAIGTEGGAPISVTSGGFLKDAHGSIIIPKMDELQLSMVAQEGGGRYSLFRLDDGDIEHLMAGMTINRMQSQTEGTGLHADRWHEEGPWLLLLVLPLAALAFRRGYLVAVVLVFLVFPERAYPFDWDALWSNSNQRASQALEHGNPEHAAELFTDPQWKATAQYRAEQFDQAVTSLENIETPEALYNKGNALARGGRFPDAIEAYETALGLDDTHEDARHNRDLIEEFLVQQQRQQDGQGDESDDEQQSSQESEDQQGDQQQQDSASADANAGNERPDQQDGQEETQGDQDEVQQAQSNPDQRSTDSRDQTVADAREDLESQQAYEQWLRRIPDDPGGLLRRKFLHQYQQRPQQPAENILW
ncbi:MAG TPA: VWA domain-containing protein [Nitrospirales bacterium]|nr:VWA domain-containing protein [Nitrospirales bacterium]